MDVELRLDGDPVMVVGVEVVVTMDPAGHADLVDRAVARSAIVQAVRGECPVGVTTRSDAPRVGGVYLAESGVPAP